MVERGTSRAPSSNFKRICFRSARYSWAWDPFNDLYIHKPKSESPNQMTALAHMINVETSLIIPPPPPRVSSNCIRRKMTFRAKPLSTHLCRGWWKVNHSQKIKEMKIQAEQLPFSQLLQIHRIRKDYQEHRAWATSLARLHNFIDSKPSYLSVWIFNDFLIANICHRWAYSSPQLEASQGAGPCYSSFGVMWGSRWSRLPCFSFPA